MLTLFNKWTYLTHISIYHTALNLLLFEIAFSSVAGHEFLSFYRFRIKFKTIYDSNVYGFNNSWFSTGFNTFITTCSENYTSKTVSKSLLKETTTCTCIRVTLCFVYILFVHIYIQCQRLLLFSFATCINLPRMCHN